MIRGLLLKEVYSMKTQFKVWIVLYLFYFVIALVTKSGDLLFFMTPIIGLIMCINMMAFDVQYKWDQFVLCTPVKRATVVCSQYLFIVLLEVFTTVTALVLGLCLSPQTGEAVQEILGEAGGVLVAGLLLVDVSFPLQYKFGIEKARYLLLAICLVPALCVFLFSRLGNLFHLPDVGTLRFLLYLLPLAVVLFTLLSLWLSIRIYRKKEY